MTDVRTDGPRADESVAELTRHLTETDVTRQAKARIDRATQRIEHRRDQLRDALGSPGTGPPAHSAVAETTRKPVPLGIALAAAAAGFMIGRRTGGR
jgi:hypothetical protein